ncbi:16S rRNA (cytosine(1402)-N(4))-methyltransferase RsmH [Jonquetella anthropi]|uniref:16S rRNA (cytosine(1402)-N(4))-methyltransferase RsmH n=1 Tax=Jonquetella anthropi TaxID=428712 RepID=UPI000301BD3F|nr:16S rRNA (cytosine(1402)-N(4))-methyltransferase RsmH [Jonquetella anthropi]
MAFEHRPVMLQEVMDSFPRPPVGLVVDATLGLGGYSEAFLSRWPECRVAGIDQDGQARAIAQERLARWADRFAVWPGNFRRLNDLMASHGEKEAAGVVVDLGVSNLQITEGERGFSFREDGPLDMRMNASEGLTASQLVNQMTEDELAGIFFRYGEERFARSIARAIARRRGQSSIETTGQLVEVIREGMPAAAQRKANGHPARRVFQALRIAVNDELGALEDLLSQVCGLLADGGVFVAVTYHSLEDRLVKRAMREWEGQWLGIPVSRRGLTPSEDEVLSNPKSRSARLRAFERRDNYQIEQGRLGPWRR